MQKYAKKSFTSLMSSTAPTTSYPLWGYKLPRSELKKRVRRFELAVNDSFAVIDFVNYFIFVADYAELSPTSIRRNTNHRQHNIMISMIYFNMLALE